MAGRKVWWGFFVLSSAVAARANEANPHAREAIEKCKRGLAELQSIEPAAKAVKIATACADLYAEPRCRAAWTNFDVPPSRRIPFVISECRDAYCPRLAESKAAICKDPFDPSAATTRQQWAELQALIFARDLGPDGARELVAAFAGAATKVAAAATATAAVKDDLGLTLDVSDQELRLYSQSGSEGTVKSPKLVLRRRASDGAFDYAALRRALAEIVRRRWPQARPEESKALALSADRDVTFEQVIRLMDVARESFPNVSFSVKASSSAAGKP